MFNHSARNGGRIACVMGDVDRFKSVNVIMVMPREIQFFGQLAVLFAVPWGT